MADIDRKFENRQNANFQRIQENLKINEESLSSTMAPARPHKRSLATESTPKPIDNTQHFMKSLMAFETVENVARESSPPPKKQKTSASTSSDSGISCDSSDDDLTEYDKEIEEYLTSDAREVNLEDVVVKKDPEDDTDQHAVFFDEQAYYERKEEMQREEQEKEQQDAERKAQEIHHKYFNNYF